MLLCTIYVFYQLLFIVTKTFVQSLPVHSTAKTTEQTIEIPGFENIPTYIKQLYAIVSKGNRPDLMHNGDSLRSYFDEGKKMFSIKFSFPFLYVENI